MFTRRANVGILKVAVGTCFPWAFSQAQAHGSLRQVRVKEVSQDLQPLRVERSHLRPLVSQLPLKGVLCVCVCGYSSLNLGCPPTHLEACLKLRDPLGENCAFHTCVQKVSCEVRTQNEATSHR